MASLAAKAVRMVLEAPVVGAGPRALRDMSAARDWVSRASQHRVPYGSFSEARRARAVKPIGYETCPGDLYEGLRHDLIPGDQKALEWLEKKIGQVRRVFDFGGNIGLQYYGFGSRIEFPASLRWTVGEISPFVEEGARIAAREGKAQLDFTHDFAPAAEVDFLLVSGVLHYLEEEFSERLRGLRAMPPRMLINRAPLIEGPSTVTLQDIGKALLPVVLRNREAFLQDVTGCGYRLVDEWQVPELKCTMPLYPERSAHFYSGFYFEKD
jgi:putative methyltransferase (TIGR04325 family)